MRSRILPVAGVAAIALVAATALASTASASGHSASASHKGAAQAQIHASKKACYSNTTGDTGTGISSANYSDQVGIDSAGAADFTVKKTCKISKVQTAGVYYNGGGPADSVNVFIYKAKKGVPGKVVAKAENSKYTDSSGVGALGVKLSKAVTLKKGSYFVSFVANMTLSVGGQWGWETTSNQIGNADLWENPDNGFGTGCTTWQPLSCIGYSGDFMVSF
jgi:hypothetical protein